VFIAPYLRLFFSPPAKRRITIINLSHFEHGAIFGDRHSGDAVRRLLSPALPARCYGYFAFVVLLAPTSSFIPLRIRFRAPYLPAHDRLAAHSDRSDSAIVKKPNL
jgi:hypothetical protein